MSTLKLTIHQPTKQQLADYANAILVVNGYAFAITNQDLPVLSHPPANYATFTELFAPAKQHALNWTENIFVQMMQMPKTIKGQAKNFFNMESTMINSYLETLINDPANSTAKKGLNEALSALQSNIMVQVNNITDIENSLTAFATHIAADEDVLTSLAQKALDAAGNDKTTIINLNADIATLNDEIATARKVLEASEIGIVVGIFACLVGVVVCLFPGGKVIGGAIIVGGVALTGLGIAGTVIEKKNIKAMQAQITSDQEQISEIKKDIVLLTNVSNQFKQLKEKNVKAQNALKKIKTQWQNLVSAIDEVKDDLANVEKDKKSADYAKAKKDFKMASDNWNEVVEFATALAGISVKWQDKDGNVHDFTEMPPSIDNAKVMRIPKPASAEVEVA